MNELTIPQKIFRYIRASQGKIVTREEIGRLIYEGYFDRVDKKSISDYINVSMVEVRKMFVQYEIKLKTVRGVGYLYEN